MSTDTPTPGAAFDDFVALVRRNLERNGFPGNGVSLPLERMYEEADKRGFSFNKVRDALAKEGVATHLTDERVVFEAAAAAEPVPGAGLSGSSSGSGYGFGDDDGDGSVGDADLFATAQEMFARMSPAEREELMRMMNGLDPEEIARMQREFEALPPEEKARLHARMSASL